ncbi:MAG: DUF3006 domain-containing protein [Defluviitaleaceae bacterium]|nr:DUF3006 domain-containing protein [Defluviitaleaceae bacterium]
MLIRSGEIFTINRNGTEKLRKEIQELMKELFKD